MREDVRTDRYDVAIVGASFAGLALALALRQGLGEQLRIALVDKADPASQQSPPDDPRAYALSAASRNLLEALDAWSTIAPQAQPVHEIEITDSSLDHVIRPVLLRYANALENHEPASFIVPHGALFAALAARLGSTQISLFAARAFASLAIDDALAIVTLDNGERISASLVVAADGRASAVRDAAGIKTISWDYPQIGIVTTIQHARDHQAKAVQHFLPGGPFAILPLPGGMRSCITWSEERELGQKLCRLDDEAFIAEVERRVGGRWGEIGLAGGRMTFPLSMHLARRYALPRVALIGDAAHGVHPIAGQGLNLALRDVAALAEVLVETARLGIDIGSGEAMERYERWRRLDSMVSAASFDMLNRVFSSDSAVLRQVRDLGLGVVDRLPGLKALLVGEAAGLTGDVPRLLRNQPL